MEGKYDTINLADDMMVSVIIPAFNEELIIQDTIQRIEHAFAVNRGRGIAWEIIVCDNDSTDGTAQAAREAGARVVSEPARQISRARNTGAGIADGGWYLFIDADSYPRPELVTEMLDLVESGEVIGCGTTVLVEGGTLFNRLRMERMNPFFRFLTLSGGAFLLCRADAFHSLGEFSIHLYALEDIDFVMRLKALGRKQGKEFAVLYRYPVITSGRRGEYRVLPLAVLFLSNFMAVILFFLQYFLPKSWVAKLGSWTMGYWYTRRG